MAEVDWCSLFSSLGLEWRDRGKNVSAGNIVIGCPWCGHDDGLHLSVSINGKGYYCYRNASHAGRDPVQVLVKLGVERARAIKLYNEYLIGGEAPRAVTAAKPPERVSQWFKFLPADGEYLDYLARRGFPDPEAVARRYGLRRAQDGRWARRLLFPIPDMVQPTGWTGRALDAWNSPPYCMSDNIHSPIYAPNPPRRRVIIVEGPMDALKLAVASDAVCPISLLGKDASWGKVNAIAAMVPQARDIDIVLDWDAWSSEAQAVYGRLRPLLREARLRMRPPPFGGKDAGDASITTLKRWIDAAIS